MGCGLQNNRILYAHIQHDCKSCNNKQYLKQDNIQEPCKSCRDKSCHWMPK